MPDDDPIPFYPNLRCHMAPLRFAKAPKRGCYCRICDWARARNEGETLLAEARGPIRPGTPEWGALLAAAA